MKLKELFFLLGIKPKARIYNWKLKKFNFEKYGSFEYAQWLHPAEKEKNFTTKEIINLKSFINEGDFCIDVGAHTGDSTLPIALATGSKGLVLALEPNPFVFRVLTKNVILNLDKLNILPMQIGATLNNEDLVFEYSDAGYCNGGRHENISRWKHGHAFELLINGINLSNLLMKKFKNYLPKLKFIKIDTEGYDLMVLNSLKDIIKKYKPNIKAEVFKHTSLQYREEMFNFFNDLNFSIYKIENEENYKYLKIEKKDFNKWEHFDIFCSSKK